MAASTEFGTPSYSWTDCNADGIEDMLMENGVVDWDFRTLTNRVSALDVTLVAFDGTAEGTVQTFDPAQKSIRVALPPAHAPTVSGQIHFYRPENARLDHAVALAVNATGVQTVDATALATGLWKVRVAWSANGQDYFYDQSVIVN